MWLFGALLTFLVSATPTPSPEPTAPRFDWGVCPFEGCVYREWTATRKALALEELRPTSREVFRVQPGESVQALTGVVITTTLGRVRAVAPTSLGAANHVAVTPGDKVYVLRYVSEGFYLIWARGRTFEHRADFDRLGPVRDQPSLEVLSVVQTEWWVRLRNKEGLEGWCPEPRNFTGNDALVSPQPNPALQRTRSARR
jgi:hypothetical protein